MSVNLTDLFDRVPLPVRYPLPGFGGATAWLGTEPLSSADLRGKVVLVDFWTFTCINWIRTLPHTRAWAETYGQHGLVVIGVHTPEFSIERGLDRVARAVRDLGVPYAVAVDDDDAVWNAFANRYWPARYLADADGRVRHHHFGEGGYQRTENVIRRLLTDAGAADLPAAVEPVDALGIEAAADWDHVGSSETYVGAARSVGFASPEGDGPGEPRAYTTPSRLQTNEWALAGRWTVAAEGAVSNEPGARITYRFHARDLNLILAPASEDRPARFWVRLDGEPPGCAHGLDTDEDGAGVVDRPRLYQLVRQPGAIDDHLFEVELLDPGVTAYCFTFG
jgi:thiol-disulfide isomerase/thioredoxin